MKKTRWKKNSRILALITTLAFALGVESSAAMKTPDPSLLESPWDANWIEHPEAAPRGFGVFHFRKKFTLNQAPNAFVVHVSADPRYRLFVNGKSVSIGPAAGDQLNWRFETVDISEHLATGENVIAALVWNFADLRPLSHNSFQSAFLLQGDSDTEAILNTDSSWKVYKNTAYELIPVSYQDVDGYFAASPGERFDVRKHPWDWKYQDFDDSEWLAASELYEGTPQGVNQWGNLYGWSLVPREIPAMEEYPIRMKKIRRSEGIQTEDTLLLGTRPLSVPANTSATLLIDQSHLTNAYPRLLVSGGSGASIKLTYAESLRNDDNQKGNRDEVDGKRILGLHDVFLLDGSDERLLEPLWLRTYRYIEMEIETSGDPLEIHDVYGIFTGYPFEENAVFASDDLGLKRIWDVGWRTARLNAFETYWDCPYYEQLQYVGDTRIQALISLYVSGDDRLMRKAIVHYDQSRSPQGITMSRYPSRHPQYIPPYSLLWIAMVHDYWMHRDDEDFVKQFLPGIESVIDWYENYIRLENGLLGPMPWWNFVDGVTGNDTWRGGKPVEADDGNSVVVALQLLYALQYAQELAEHFDREEEAIRYERLIDLLRNSIPKQAWDKNRKLYSDTPEFVSYSQHANILAILTDLVPKKEQAALMRKVIEDDSLSQASYYFKFYFFRALRKSGLGNEYLGHMQPWYDALDLGMTTFPEYPEPTRSDAHAWSSSPNYDFLATVAGIRPDAPGFSKVIVEPKPGHLTWFEASVPHPLGPIEAKLEFKDDKVKGTLRLPEGLEGRFVWNGKEKKLKSGAQNINL